MEGGWTGQKGVFLGGVGRMGSGREGDVKFSVWYRVCLEMLPFKKRTSSGSGCCHDDSISKKYK